jgi:cell wall-associated NlpC family hydrolase
MDNSSPAFDPRLTPARADLAARHLEGQVRAARFVEGALHEVTAAQAPLRDAPAPDALLLTEALKGERVTVYETTDEGWAWGQIEADGYVGWLATSALAPPGPSPTHKVAVTRTLVFPGPSIRLPPVETLSFGARVAIKRIEGPLAVTATRACVPARHLVPVEYGATDFVAVAEMFLHVPYLWGGKTSAGIDCSGLVQIALTACGIPCPRDSDMQEASLGQPVPWNLDDLKRGDLVFWKGHVAIARDPLTLIHANAFHMTVAIEPLREAVERIRTAGSEVTSVRRISAAA